ncbi:MAG: MliC family protein [Acidobacteria bacterium]|nr:MliC family protein [Acidobacteriota bacterium]
MRARIRCVVMAVVVFISVPALNAQGPTFDCAKAKGEVEQLICKDAALAALDRKLDGVYKAALAKARDGMPARLRTEQRGWVSGRNECWKAKDADNAVFLTASWTATSVRECVESQYRLRIAELQVQYGLVPSKKPAFFACQNNPSNVVAATFFETDPPSARIERGDQSVVAYLVPAASGAKYEGQNVTFWNKGSEVAVSWRHPVTGETAELQCKARP